MNKSKKKILIIGPAPQNIGGISLHIRRLINLLNPQYEFDIVDEGRKRYQGVFNLRSLNLIKYIKKVCHVDIVHIHSGVPILRIFHIIFCALLCRKCVIVTIHRNPAIEKMKGLTLWFLKYCDHIILVNKEGYELISRKDTNCKYYLLPAFLPPIISEEQPLPNEVIEWIVKCRQSKNSVIMVSNAWKLVMHQGQDLYGLDMCIQAMKDLLNDDTLNKSIYLIFVIADDSDADDIIHKYQKDIEQNNLNRNILIWKSSLSFVNLINESDIVLRTTNTDGDAISIREALYLGKKVIASDVVARPDDVILFKTRDVNSLVETIKEAINSENGEKVVASTVNYKEIYSKIYC